MENAKSISAIKIAISTLEILFSITNSVDRFQPTYHKNCKCS